MAQPTDGSEGTVTVEFRFYAPFREQVGEKSVPLELPPGATVGDALARIADRYPETTGEILDESGGVRDGVRAIRNGRSRAEADVELEDGDTVSLTTPIHGG